MIDFDFGVTLSRLDKTNLYLYLKWRNDRNIFRWCRQDDLISIEEQANWFDRIEKDPSAKMYQINLGDIPVGVCGLTDIDHKNKRAEFSLYIRPDYHGKKLAEPALKTLLKHGFLNLGLNCIWGETFEDNKAQYLFSKVGMKQEGHRREFYYKNGRYCDAILFSMTKDDFDNLDHKEIVKCLPAS